MLGACHGSRGCFVVAFLAMALQPFAFVFAQKCAFSVSHGRSPLRYRAAVPRQRAKPTDDDTASSTAPSIPSRISAGTVRSGVAMHKPIVTFSANNLGDFPIYEQVLRRWAPGRRLPFVEILWDNYIHLDADVLRRAVDRLADGVALHIMWSKFMELPEPQLESYLGAASHARRCAAPPVRV